MKNNKKIYTISRLISVLSACCFMLFASCEDKSDVQKGFEIDGDSFGFNQYGGSAKITIKSDQPWTAAANVEWCLVSPANGIGNTVCEVLVDTSYLYNGRDAVVTFYAGPKEHVVNISQLGFKKEIFLKDKPQILPHFEFKGKNTFEINVFSNVAYELQIHQDEQEWLEAESFRFEPVSVPRPQKIKFTYDANNRFEQRAARLVFTPVGTDIGDAEPLEVEILQEASPFIPVNSRAGDSMALLSIGRQIDLYWPYDPSKNMESWSDVMLEERTFSNEQGESVTEMRVTGVRFFLFDTESSLPFEITYLTELEKLITIGNSNSHLKKIKLGPEVTQLKKLKHLELFAYGISELCPEIIDMTHLELLDMDANCFSELPLDMLKQMPFLKSIGFGNNRLVVGITDLSNVTDDNIGIGGQLPADLFKKTFFPNLKELILYHNYYEGAIPDIPLTEVCEFESLKLNGNMISGIVPDWVLQHKHLTCWDPYIFIFNQGGKDSNGKPAIFENEPVRITGDCELWEEDNNNGDIDYNPDWNLLKKYGVTRDLYFKAMSISLSCK